MKRIVYCVLAILLGIGFFSASSSHAGNPPSKYYLDQAKLPFESLPGTETSCYWGILGNAGYRIEVPANWNRRLVIYCHGYRYGNELTVSNNPIRSYLISNGYAWAASSYSTNGYDVKRGVLDTHALAKFFNDLVEKPVRTYLVGYSMGGHIIGVAIEHFSKSFDGALPMCGVMADIEICGYCLDYHLVAQWLTETQVTFPFPPNYVTEIIPAMKEKLGTPFPTNLNDAGMKLLTATKYLSGGERPLFTEAFKYWANERFGHGLDPTWGGIVRGNLPENIGIIYQLDDDPELSDEEIALNEEILRVASDPQVRGLRGLANFPKISGNISIPVLTLSAIGDLEAPLLMEQIYAQRVAAKGKSDLLVQRVIRDVGHCSFSFYEIEAAFADLVNWVENGVKPEGDDVLTPSVVSDPKFGCKFTTFQHWIDPNPWACTDN